MTAQHRYADINVVFMSANMLHQYTVYIYTIQYMYVPLRGLVLHVGLHADGTVPHDYVHVYRSKRVGRSNEHLG